MATPRVRIVLLNVWAALSLKLNWFLPFLGASATKSSSPAYGIESAGSAVFNMINGEGVSVKLKSVHALARLQNNMNAIHQEIDS